MGHGASVAALVYALFPRAANEISLANNAAIFELRSVGGEVAVVRIINDTEHLPEVT